MSIDDRIESAGSRLASTPVAVPELERLVRRRSRRVRVIAVVGSVVVVSIGVAALVRHDGSAAKVDAKSVVPTDSHPGDPSARHYELALEGATLVDDSTSTARGAPNAVWFDEATGTYLTLDVLPGEATTTREPSGFAPMVEDTTFASTRGRAWFTDTGSSSIRRMTMWWSRPDGDVWLVESFWYGDNPVQATDGRSALRSRALAIASPDPSHNQQHYELADPSLRRVAEDQGGDVQYRVQVWTYQVGSVVENITLMSTQASVATSVIAALTHGKPELVRIDGHDAWQVTDSATGDIYIGWQAGEDRPAWVALTIPASLASLTLQIRAALRSG